MKELNEGIIEKKIIIGGDEVNAVSFDGRGAIFRNKPNAPVSDFALLLGMKIDRRIQYPFDCTYPCGKKVNIDRKGGANDGARPVLPINDLIKLGANIKIEDKEIIFGEFPQTVVKDKKLISTLEEKLNKKELWKTDKKFNLPSGDNTLNTKPIVEYEYQGKRYVRYESNVNLSNPNFNYKEDKAYWVEVEPVKWEIKGNRAITSNFILSNLCYIMAHAYLEVFMQDITKNYKQNRLSELKAEKERIEALIEQLQKETDAFTRKLK